MEIIAKLESASYYHRNQFVYCNVIVLEKRLIDLKNPNIQQFENIIIGQPINLKYNKSDTSEVLKYLPELVLYFKLTGVETKREKNNTSVKFLFEGCSKCAIFQGQ